MAPKAKKLLDLGPTFLKQYRVSAGYSQDSAARLLDISPPQLSLIESSKSPYTQRLLERAAILYRCTPADLLGRDPVSPPTLDLSALFQVVVIFERSCIRNNRVTRATPEQKADAVVLLYRLLASGDKITQNEIELDNRLKLVWEEDGDG